MHLDVLEQFPIAADFRHLHIGVRPQRRQAGPAQELGLASLEHQILGTRRGIDWNRRLDERDIGLDVVQAIGPGH